jgi:hypothetical protein
MKNFSAVQSLKSTIVIKAALNELVDATAAFTDFVPVFTSHPLFQEIPPAVFHLLEKFLHKNPNFDMPPNYSKIVKLDARIRNTLTQTTLDQKVAVTPTGPRADKSKKGKVPNKRVRLSKEFIDDSDGDEPAQFIPSTTIDPVNSGPKSAEEIVTKVLDKVAEVTNKAPRCSSCQDSHTPAPCSKVAGTLVSTPMEIDDPAPPIADQDRDAITRARTIVSNPTILDITAECSKDAEFLQNSLRLQILQGCQHLRSYLSSVDSLMGRYHDSIAANPPSSDNE